MRTEGECGLFVPSGLGPEQGSFTEVERDLLLELKTPGHRACAGGGPGPGSRLPFSFWATHQLMLASPPEPGVESKLRSWLVKPPVIAWL